MIPPPPTSTLFPYTTLFRSLARHGEELPRRIGFHRQDRSCDGRAGDAVERDRMHLRLAALAIGDRKSTRLNSSHSQISYAVFCLKKKKTSQSNTSYVPYYMH